MNQDNNVFIDFTISKKKLNTYFSASLQNYNGKKISADGIDFILKNVSDQLISLHVQQKTLFITLPISFEFIKNAGLFSIEGEGNIRIHLEVLCEINASFELKTTTTLASFDWLVPPIIHLGQWDMPIETLSNCIIHFIKSSMMESIDEKISNNIDFKSLIRDQMQQHATNYLISQKPHLYFNAILHQITCDFLKEDDDYIYIDMWVEFSAKISDQMVQFEVISDPSFYWLDNKIPKNAQNIEVEISLTGIAKLIQSELNGKTIGGKRFEVESIFIRNTSFLEIKAHLIDPIKGILTITCQPKLVYNLPFIDVDGIKVDMVADNIIYKLSSPIIEKVIENKLEALFPFDPSVYLDQYINHIPQIHLFDNQIALAPKVSALRIEKWAFTDQSLIISLMVDNTLIEVNL